MTSNARIHPSERRQFGRRKTCMHGWVVMDVRPKLPCLVRNVSAGGALLELEVPKNMPFRFKLIIDSKGFEALCEMRHTGPGWMGVQFVNFERVVEPIAEWSVELEDRWAGKP